MGGPGASEAAPPASDVAAAAETEAAPPVGDAAATGEAEAEADALDVAMQEKQRGAELYKQQKPAEARDAWEEALRRLPEGQFGHLALSLHLNLAQAALTLKDYEEVVKQATAALALDEENAKALFRRGTARDALGQVQAAAGDLRRSARLEPRNAEVRKRYEEVKQKAALEVENEDRPPNHNLAELPRVWLDVAVGVELPRRLLFALYSDSVPKTAENFRQLCTGEGRSAGGRPLHYKGCLLHRLVRGLMVQGGDFDHANGTGGESIYGRRFADENFCDKHTRRGLLAMANDGPNTNSSNFFVSFAAAEHLDRHHVIFGELLEGWELLDELERLETDAQCRPLVDCVVADCGALPPASAG